MSGGGKGGSQTQRVEIPDWLQAPVERSLNRAEQAASIGYTPWTGPDVAALSGGQQAAMQNTNAAAAAFGLAPAQNSLPAATDYGNGMTGYSGMDMYLQALAAMPQGQRDAIMGMFINPQTGALPAGMPVQQPVPQPGQPGQPGPPSPHGNLPGWHPPAERDPPETAISGGGGGGGGYTGIRDMFDGGGPGASGPRYSGGGLLSELGNLRNDIRGR